MSRSIHDTWGVLRRTRRENYSDPAEKLERVRALRANIADQRALKSQTRHQRRRRGLSLGPFDPDCAYRDLAWGVADGVEPAKLRRDFGSMLSAGGHHREALLVLERALAEHPGDVETMRYLVGARVEAGHVEEAEALWARLREIAPEDGRTWLLEARLHRRCARWAEQARSAERAMALWQEGEERRLPLAYRADAWLGLERWEDLSTDIAALRAIGSRQAHAQADVLTLRMPCRTGRWKEGFTSARRLLRGGRLGLTDDAFAKAARFECAHRLGRSTAAGKLTERTIELLRSAGQGAWVDRLAADFGL
jgi:tetratricopeptide (TPR) repeat protein